MRIERLGKHITTSYTDIHTCKPLSRMPFIKVVKMKGLAGWYFVDEGVEVNGTDSCYAMAIFGCPFCLEKLMEEN